MFTSSLTEGLYREFMQSFQLDKTSYPDTPFVYVDSTSTEIKLVTNVMLSESSDEVLAYTLVANGDLEVLSTEE